jgi:hypothetical protein
MCYSRFESSKEMAEEGKVLKINTKENPFLPKYIYN